MAGITGGFFGTLLSWLTNSIYKIRTEQYCDRRIVDGLLISMAMGLFAGGFALGYVLFDASILEDDNSVESTFISIFLTTFFSISIDTLLGIVKQASSRLFGSKDID